MKVVLREWLKDRKACAMMILYFIMHTAYIAIDARIILMTAEVLADPSHMRDNLFKLGLVSMIAVILAAGQSYLPPSARNHCFNRLNNAHIDKLLEADYGMFTKFSCSRIWTAGGFMWNITTVGVRTVQMVNNVVSIIIMLVSMFLVGGPVVVPIIVLYVLSTIVIWFIYKALDKNAAEKKENTKKRNQEAENTVNGFCEVRSFNTIEAHRSSLHSYNKKIYDCNQKRNSTVATMHGTIEFLEKAGMVIAAGYAVVLLASGQLEQAAGMSLIMYVIRLINPLMSILDYADDLAEELALAGEFSKIQYYQNQNELNGTVNLDSFNEEIKLEDVSFRYDDDSANAVNHVNISVRKGQKIGICGVSGGGKSTIFKLINRFYRPNSGKITIDGIDVNDISRDSYCRHIGSVHQENFVFPGSIRENVMYGSPNALESEMVEACKRANIYEFIQSLPERFDTEVGPRGLKLSGGQKQRIALARLFLRNPDVILLDEATSALDNESETLIQEAIEALSDKTIITIAHRLSTIRNCDCIYVINNSGVIECGTHEELVERNGAYAAMLK